MKRIGIYLLGILVITNILPTVIVKNVNLVPSENTVSGEGFSNNDSQASPTIVRSEKKPAKNEDIIESIKIYDAYSDKVLEMPLDDYIKGVVAAEMPAAFDIEALKAQAIASRTYAISRNEKYSEGHPNHKGAPLCTEIHCQAYLSPEELKTIHGEEWEEKYWGKIEEAVDSTSGTLLYYKGEIIEPLYHSTSGGRTEDVVDVYATDVPYLKSVSSPYEEEAPKYKTVTTMTGDEFVKKINENYKNAAINLENFYEKIKLIEKSDTGRTKKIAVGNEIINGSEFRQLFNLNSTNFVITYDKDLNLIDITTHGYGHGVGMSQYGANGMAKKGSNYEEILEHYYTGVELK